MTVRYGEVVKSDAKLQKVSSLGGSFLKKEAGELNHASLYRRGPDSHNTIQVDVSDHTHLTLTGSVLHLRGDLTPQPYTDSSGNILLWNGEIFNGIQVNEDENDARVLAHVLDTCETTQALVDVFSRIEGPWAVIYWQKSSETLWFGRDVLGRRSLLWHLPSDVHEPLVISSVCLSQNLVRRYYNQITFGTLD